MSNTARKLSNPKITVNNPSPKRSASIPSSRSVASSSTASPKTVKPVEKTELNLTLYGGPVPRRDNRCVSGGTSIKRPSKNDQKHQVVSPRDIECSSLLNSEICDDDFLLDLSTMSETDTEKISMKPNYVSPNRTRRNSSSTYRRNSAGSTGSRRSKTSGYSPRNTQASRSSSRKSSLGIIKPSAENSTNSELLQLLETPRSVISPTETSSSVSSSRRTTPGNSSHLSSSQSSAFDLSSESVTPSAHSETSGDTARTYISSSSSCYMSWADHSLNSEYFSKTPSEIDVEEKDGEWGYFWRNYNNSINSYRKSHSQRSKDANMEDDASLTKETADLESHKPAVRSGSLNQVTLTADEAEEAANCAQRLADILRQAMKKPVHFPSNNKSLNVNQKVLKSYSEPELFKRLTPVTAKELKDQKKLLKPVKSSSVSVNFENSGVLDVANILRKAIEKRRDFLIPPEEVHNTCKSDWSIIE